jgi:hypothetical protein
MAGNCPILVTVLGESHSASLSYISTITVDKSVGKLFSFPAFAGVRSLTEPDCKKNGQ